MCGLVAMIARQSSGFSYKDEAIFEQLLFSDTLRGSDSTGIFGINKYGNLSMHKTAQQAPNALATDTFKQFVKGVFNKWHVVVGHNRAATRGAKTDQNAHPFIEDHICLVHNGTLTSHKHMADKEVDSHAICHSLATKGYEQTFQDINGAFALIWFDAKEKKLYMARNKERPLNMAVTDRAFYFASELGMLQWILQRNGEDKAKYFWLAEDKTYIWDLEDAKNYTIKDTPEKKYYPVAQAAGYQTNFFPKVTGHSASTSSSDVVEYKPSEFIEFYSMGVSKNKKGNEVITGITLDGEETPVSCHLPKDLSAEERADLLDNEYLGGTIQFIHVKNSKISLFLRNPMIMEDVVTTENNEEVTKGMFEQHGGKCNNCGTTLEFNDLEKAIVHVHRNGTITGITCEHCCTLESYYGGLNFAY
jgi:predicted glutamine amidotransferase